MTVPTNDLRGVPGTLALARGLMDDWISVFGEPESAQAELSDARSSIAAAESDPNATFAAYQSVTRLFHASVGTREARISELMRSIRRHVLHAYSGRAEANVDRPDQLEDYVWHHASSWSVRPGLDALAKYINIHPRHRLHSIFTTNFDPLISAALIRNEVMHARVAFEHEDYALSRASADVPVVYHVHGHWTGEDTLNLLADMIANERSVLAESIARVMRGRTIVVIGYGGWDDVLRVAIERALADPAPRVFWVSRNDRKPPMTYSRSRFNGHLYALQVPDVDEFMVSLLESAKGNVHANAKALARTRMIDELEHLRRAVAERVSHAETLASIKSDIEGIRSTLEQSASASQAAEESARNASIVAASAAMASADCASQTKLALAAITTANTSLAQVESVANLHVSTAQDFVRHRRNQRVRFGAIFVMQLVLLFILVSNLMGASRN